MRSFVVALCLFALAVSCFADDPSPQAAATPASQPTTVPSADSIRDLKNAADAAQAALDKAKTAVIARLDQTADYQQAKSDLVTAQAALDSSRAGDPDRATLASNKLAAQSRLDKLQNDAFSKDTVTVAAAQQSSDAFAKYDAAKKQLQTDQAEAAANANAQKVIPKSTFESRSLAGWKPENLNDFQRAKLAKAKSVDAKIDAYGAAHNLPAEMVAAMHEGHASIGMPEDALSVFMRLKVSIETTDGKVYRASALDYYIPWHVIQDADGGLVNVPTAPPTDDNLMPWLITVENGKVTEIENP